MLRRKELACMYFPYADPKPSPALLMAALLFDRIYFLELNFFRPPGIDTAVPRDGRLSSELRDLGCFAEIGPQLLGFSQSASPGRAVIDASVRAEIQASIGADLGDEEGLGERDHVCGEATRLRPAVVRPAGEHGRAERRGEDEECDGVMRR